MRRLARPRRKREQPESTIALINIVFLLLIFFLIAGTLSAPRDSTVELAETETFDPAALDPAAIYVDADGALRVGGATMGPVAAMARVAEISATGAVMIVPDRRLDARMLLQHLAGLRAVTDRPLKILTRRTVPAE